MMFTVCHVTRLAGPHMFSKFKRYMCLIVCLSATASILYFIGDAAAARLCCCMHKCLCCCMHKSLSCCMHKCLCCCMHKCLCCCMHKRHALRPTTSRPSLLPPPLQARSSAATCWVRSRAKACKALRLHLHHPHPPDCEAAAPYNYTIHLHHTPTPYTYTLHLPAFVFF